MPDSDAVDFHAKAYCVIDGRFTGAERIRNSVCQDKQDFSFFRLGMQRLKNPPEGRAKGCAACRAYGKASRHAFAVAQQGKDVVCSASCGKGRDCGIDAFDAAERDSNGKAGLPGKEHGFPGHAAAAIQQDMNSRIQSRTHSFREEEAGVACDAPIQTAGMQTAATPQTAASGSLSL